MTFYQWIRKCLLWDEKQQALSENKKAALRKKVFGACAEHSTEVDAPARRTER